MSLSIDRVMSDRIARRVGDGTGARWPLIEQIAAAGTPAAVGDALCRLLAHGGFEHVHCLEVEASMAGAIATAAPHGRHYATVLDTRPAAWAEAYERDALARTDPLLAEAARRIDPFTLQDLVDLRPATAVAGAITLARQFGATSHLVVPIIQAQRRAGIVVASGRGRMPTSTARRPLAVGAVVAFQRLVALRRHDADDGLEPLSPRECEVLHWIMVGKSDWEIGQILEISKKTVNYHAENVKRKFGVSTRMQAVVAALRSGAA